MRVAELGRCACQDAAHSTQPSTCSEFSLALSLSHTLSSLMGITSSLGIISICLKLCSTLTHTLRHSWEHTHRAEFVASGCHRHFPSQFRNTFSTLLSQHYFQHCCCCLALPCFSAFWSALIWFGLLLLDVFALRTKYEVICTSRFLVLNKQIFGCAGHIYFVMVVNAARCTARNRVYSTAS